jgi:bacillithiol system protein YtxJ
MKWQELSSDEQLDGIIALSFTRAQVIFKHSTRCSISSMAKSRLERSEAPATADFHCLDLIRHRNLSDKIASVFSVTHESPQVLLIVKGECVYEESHIGINMDEINGQINLSSNPAS